MMARILHKRSATTGVVPSATELDLGEMAVNTADGKVFIKKTSGVVVEVGGAGVSSGTVTSVAAGTGLTGGTITNTGTLAVDFASSGTSSASKAVRADDSRLSDSRTPSAHTHPVGDITGLFASSGVSSSTQAVRADDSRLSDSRIPTAHTHATSDLTQSGASTGQVLGWSGSAWGPQTLSAPMQPIIKPFSTFKVCGGNNCPTMTTQPHAADQIRLYAAVWPFSFTVNAISAVVTTAAASGNIRAALYGADADGRPNGAPLLSMVGQSAATTGEKITTGLSYTIQANTIYWLGIQSGGASVTVRAHPTTSLYPLHANPASTSNYTSVLISASYASGLPTITGSSLSTLASYVSSACGAVYLRAT
jgi:hypothetical protein